MPFFIEIGRIQVRFICLLLRYDLQGCRIVTGVSFVNKERLNTLIGLQKCLRFQNEYNKVEIEHRVVKLWSEIKSEVAYDRQDECHFQEQNRTQGST